MGEEWQQQDAFIFIGAMGICVRTIAPFVNDKHEDPAVVCVDSMGLNAISVLSGHIGGANDLAREVAGIIGGREVITTQSDNAGLWALDTFEKRFDWEIASDEEELQDCIYAFVNRKPTALFLEYAMRVQTIWRRPSRNMLLSSMTSVRQILRNTSC